MKSYENNSDVSKIMFKIKTTYFYYKNTGKRNYTFQVIPGDMEPDFLTFFATQKTHSSSKFVATQTFQEKLYYRIKDYIKIVLFVNSEKQIGHPGPKNRSCYRTRKPVVRSEAKLRSTTGLRIGILSGAGSDPSC